jgi:hypothetical protein
VPNPAGLVSAGPHLPNGRTQPISGATRDGGCCTAASRAASLGTNINTTNNVFVMAMVLPIDLSRREPAIANRGGGCRSYPIAQRPTAPRRSVSFGGQPRGPTAACATSLTSCPDSEERTGIRFEKERV